MRLHPSLNRLSKSKFLLFLIFFLLLQRKCTALPELNAPLRCSATLSAVSCEAGGVWFQYLLKTADDVEKISPNSTVVGGKNN